MENNPTILYVDDDENDVLLLKHALRCCKLSFNLQVVNDPERASAYLGGQDIYADRKLYPIPSLVLLDLKMPRMNGMEVLAWIRSQPALKHLVVIVFTASNQASEVNRAYEMGANSYLVKPVELELLVEIVKGMTQYWMTLNEQPAL
ncbi:response regulator [Pedosphaera parvula]|uniref:Response regulator receiver protein n=1 Tax=Pedosphaera parvula (strain Ellin514) TaxID=320771 RepID=B9XQ38_PEDPL|nr:response regulator [Pedosphaera parvula]EEF58042.1 response regulator receiver protein [Pedosphaera parvula Ellin514]